MGAYDAILGFTDSNLMGDDNGKLLNDFVESGGGLVLATFAIGSVPIDRDVTMFKYYVLQASGQTMNLRRTLGTVQAHPIIVGLTTFDGGSSSYRARTTNLAPGASTIASYDDGAPLISVNTVQASSMLVRRCDLSFFPPSSNARGDFWVATTQGGLILFRSILWTLNGT